MSNSFGQYHCLVCLVAFNSEGQLNQHFLGSKHETKAAGVKKQINEKIKATGTSNSVKEESSSQNKEIPNTVAVNSSSTPVTYCSTCRINLSSPSRLQAHFTGAKHRELQRLQEAKKSKSGVDDTQNEKQVEEGALVNANKQQPFSFDNPDTFCRPCRLRLISAIEAQVHYSGERHRLRLKSLAGPKIEKTQVMDLAKKRLKKQSGYPGKFGSTIRGRGSSTQYWRKKRIPPEFRKKGSGVMFCETCRIGFASDFQADEHFNGSKHIQKVIRLEEVKNVQNQPQVEGEPSAKKTKYMLLCETCNVTLTSPGEMTSHYTGAKHLKRVAHCERMGIQQEGPNFFFCCYCNVAVNSKAQMDDHRAAPRHKARVAQIASRPQSTSTVQNMTMTSTNPEAIRNPNSINPANSLNPSYPIDTSIAPGAYPFRNNQNPRGPTEGARGLQNGPLFNRGWNHPNDDYDPWIETDDFHSKGRGFGQNPRRPTEGARGKRNGPLFNRGWNHPNDDYDPWNETDDFHFHSKGSRFGQNPRGPIEGARGKQNGPLFNRGWNHPNDDYDPWNETDDFHSKGRRFGQNPRGPTEGARGKQNGPLFVNRGWNHPNDDYDPWNETDDFHSKGRRFGHNPRGPTEGARGKQNRPLFNRGWNHPNDSYHPWNETDDFHSMGRGFGSHFK